jgi:RNA polymerase sigma-70 factor (ECF subfamily)
MVNSEETAPDDEAIVALMRDGDINAAVDGVYRRYSRDLRSFLRDQMWSDDAVDEVLAEVFKSLLTDLAGFRGEAKLRTWLRTLTRHAMLRYLKRDRVQSARVRPLESSDRDRPQPALRATFRTWIRLVYKKLDPDDREMVDLWLEGWSWKEAAEHLGATEEGLRKRFTRLMERIKDQQ